jgi:hypothetical protein
VTILGASRRQLRSLVQRSDARLVALTPLVLGVLVVGHLVGIRRPLTAATCLGVALAAVGPVLFEGVDAGSRMFPATERAM